MEAEYAKRETPIILIVDDISVNVAILENMLTHEGYETMSALNVQEALDLIRQTKPSLILSDLSMPEVDGLEFCKMLKRDPATRDIPFIFITVLNTSMEKEEAFKAGAVDYIPKPFDNVEVLMRVSNHLNGYRMRQEMANYNRMMHRLVEDQEKQIENSQANTLMALAKIMKRRNDDMGRHQDQVSYNCGILAQGLQFLPAYEDVITDQFVEAIGIAARLHDVGRFMMPDKEVEKKELLTGFDMEYARNCSEEGAEILKELCGDQTGGYFLSMAVNIAKYHHAYWDGSGYPTLAGDKIPLEARIVALANDFDNLVTQTLENGAGTVEECVEQIDGKGGILYDPDVVNVFNKIWRQMRTN